MRSSRYWSARRLRFDRKYGVSRFRSHTRTFDDWLRDLLAALSDSRSWRRHPGPFSKSKRGASRREERRFVRSWDGVQDDPPFDVLETIDVYA